MYANSLSKHNFADQRSLAYGEISRGLIGIPTFITALGFLGSQLRTLMSRYLFRNPAGGAELRLVGDAISASLPLLLIQLVRPGNLHFQLIEHIVDKFTRRYPCCECRSFKPSRAHAPWVSYNSGD